MYNQLYILPLSSAIFLNISGNKMSEQVYSTLPNIVLTLVSRFRMPSVLVNLRKIIAL